MVWGIGVLAALAVVTWSLRSPGGQMWSTAFRALLFYGLLFWASLLKIWWTAGRPAVELGEEALYYRPLYLFRPRRIPYRQIVASRPRPETQSLGLVMEEPRRFREFFLNLAVVDRRHEFMDCLGERLVAAGLEPVSGEQAAWKRPGWRADEHR
jgi:hypothetical protein